MALSLAVIALSGLFASWLLKKINMPGLLGMLIVGILLGPYVLDMIQPDLKEVSQDLRQIALIVILLRAGFELNAKTLKKVGKTSLRLSFIPETLEILGVILLAPPLLGMSLIEAAILGSVLAAVSPAVVVPYMIELQQKKIGTDKGVPSLMIAATSLDDVFVIIIFTSLLGIYSGNSSSLIYNIASVPVSIITGCLLGVLIGFALVWFFKKFRIRDTIKIIIILALAVLMLFIESILKGIVPLSGLLAVMVVGIVMLERYGKLINRLSPKFEKIWVGAQILLFVLVGSQVNIPAAINTGLQGTVVIFGALVFRSAGVYLSLIGSNLNLKEKTFCMLAYLPKATVQAAIGAVPLAMGVAAGEAILSVAVLSILITAPLGATAIKLSANKLLNKSVTT